MSNLYIVATPIGNLEDITLRALRILKEVDIIAAEDTRHTKNMLTKYEIDKRLIACHAHNESDSAKGILALLDDGNNIAYCSDAGTPCISDPGSRLVEEIRQSEHNIIPIPGVSAVTTLLSCAGNIGKTFTFEGFLSPKKGKRMKRLQELIERGESFVIYESPFRVIKTLEDICEIDENIKVVCSRELTKVYEEFISSSAKEVLEQMKKKPSVKGEFAICVSPGVL